MAQHTLSRRHFLAVAGAASAAPFLGRLGAGSAYAAYAASASAPMTLHNDLPNAEPQIGGLVDTWMTPTEQLYIRNHAHSPAIDGAAFRLKVEGLVERELTLSLADLTQDFTELKTIATLQCAGNRRSEMNDVKMVGGVPWGPGAIGNVEWHGVPLAAILEKAGVKDGAKHVQFVGGDDVHHGGEVFGFGGSVPLAKALSAESMLAYGMNGDALNADHGYPLRSFIPGYIGARSVKWLTTIRVAEEESDNHYHAGAYKVFPPTEDGATADWAAAEALGVLPVNSYIAHTETAGGTLVARGWAFAGGEPLARVDQVLLSLNGGESWYEGTIVSPNIPNCWVLWEARLPKPERAATLMARATNTRGETQPEALRDVWNFKGYFNTSWHSVAVG